MSKVYHVEMKEPMNGERHFYFGSQVAIYDVFSVEQVGISYKSLRGYNITKQPYENKKCIIRLGKLHRKHTNRGPRPQQFFHY